MSRVIGHYAPWLPGAIVLVLIGLTLAPETSPILTWYVLVLVLASAVVVAGALVRHNRGLCDRCIASVPLDASATASRYGTRFRVAHMFENKAFAISYLAIVVSTSLLYFHPVGKYVWASAQATLGYLLVVYVTHQRLAPWCPYCRNGGEEQSSPTAPQPVSTFR